MSLVVPTQSSTISTARLPTGADAITETINPDVLQWGFALACSGASP
jgi:hypothetical protein